MDNDLPLVSQGRGALAERNNACTRYLVFKSSVWALWDTDTEEERGSALHSRRAWPFNCLWMRSRQQRRCASTPLDPEERIKLSPVIPLLYLRAKKKKKNETKKKKKENIICVSNAKPTTIKSYGSGRINIIRKSFGRESF